MRFHESFSEVHEPFFAVGKPACVKAFRDNVRDHCGKSFLRDNSARRVYGLYPAKFAFSERVRFLVSGIDEFESPALFTEFTVNAHFGSRADDRSHVIGVVPYELYLLTVVGCAGNAVHLKFSFSEGFTCGGYLGDEHDELPVLRFVEIAHRVQIDIIDGGLFYYPPPRINT